MHSSIPAVAILRRENCRAFVDIYCKSRGLGISISKGYSRAFEIHLGEGMGSTGIDLFIRI